MTVHVTLLSFLRLGDESDWLPFQTGTGFEKVTQLEPVYFELLKCPIAPPCFSLRTRAERSDSDAPRSEDRILMVAPPLKQPRQGNPANYAGYPYHCVLYPITSLRDRVIPYTSPSTPQLKDRRAKLVSEDEESDHFFCYLHFSKLGFGKPMSCILQLQLL